jgi:hypothetical protein
MPGAVFACFMMRKELARKAGTRLIDFRKKRDVNAWYSRSGSTDVRCVQGLGGGNIPDYPPLSFPSCPANA